MSVRVVPMQAEYLAQLGRAFARGQDHHRPLALWRHIFEASPDGSAGVVALDDSERIVGHFGATLHRFSGAHRDAVVLGQIRDAFTDPAARTRGAARKSLFMRMVQEFHDRFGGREAHVIYGFPSARHFRVGARLLGYRRVAGLTMWERDLPAPAGNLSGRLGALATIASFDNEVDSLWNRTQPSGPLANPRTRAFLNWRFALRADRSYRLFRYDSFLSDGMAGYAVLTFSGEDARLVDFSLPQEFDLCRDMWRQVLDRAARGGARRLSLLASAAVPETKLLPALGCISRDEELPWIPAFVPYDIAWQSVDFGSAIHLTMADIDHY